MADVNIINGRIRGAGQYLLLYLDGANVFRIANSTRPIGMISVPVRVLIDGFGNELTITLDSDGIYFSTVNPIQDGPDCVPIYGAVANQAQSILINYPSGRVSAGSTTDTLDNILYRSGSTAWPPAGSTDLTTILAGTTAIWSEQFASLSLRTGGYATGSLTTGYNASTSRGTWAYNGENYMTTASTYPGLSAYTSNPNANFNWQATDPTFPPLGMADITDQGLVLKCAFAYPAIQAAVGTISGNTPYLGSFLSTAPSARFATPYLRRIRFTFNTMGTEDFPALWSTGEHYAVDINNPAFVHYEIDDIERFGSDTTINKIAISTHIDPGTGIVSAGGDYNTGVAVGPNILQEIAILHTDTQILAWWNGALAWNITPPVGSAKAGDRHHVIVNEILNPTFHPYTAASPLAQITVRSIEILKPAAVALDMIPATPPVPVITWGGSFAGGAIPAATSSGTTVATLSGGGAGATYSFIPYLSTFNKLVVSGTNLNTSGSLIGADGNYDFYVKAVNTAGTPGIAPKLRAIIGTPVVPVIAIDGTAHGNTPSGATVAATLTTTSTNDYIIATVTTNQGLLVSVVGSTLGAFTKIVAFQVGAAPAHTVEIWAKFSATAKTSEVITATNVIAGFATMDVFGVKNSGQTGLIWDTNSPKSGASDPVSITTVAANTMVIAAYRMGIASPTAGSGFTAVSGADFHLTEYKVLTSAQAVSCTITTGAGSSDGGVVVAIPVP